MEALAMGGRSGGGAPAGGGAAAPAAPARPPSQALAYQQRLQHDNPGFAYFFALPSPLPDMGVQLVDPMGAVFFEVMKRRAEGGEPRAASMMFKQLEQSAAQQGMPLMQASFPGWRCSKGCGVCGGAAGPTAGRGVPQRRCSWPHSHDTRAKSWMHQFRTVFFALPAPRLSGAAAGATAG